MSQKQGHNTKDSTTSLCWPNHSQVFNGEHSRRDRCLLMFMSRTSADGYLRDKKEKGGGNRVLKKAPTFKKGILRSEIFTRYRPPLSRFFKVLFYCSSFSVLIFCLWIWLSTNDEHIKRIIIKLKWQNTFKFLLYRWNLNLLSMCHI